MKSYFCEILLLMYWLALANTREYEIVYEYCKWNNKFLPLGHHNDPPCGQVYCDAWDGISVVTCPKLTCDVGRIFMKTEIDENKKFPDCCPRAGCLNSNPVGKPS